MAITAITIENFKGIKDPVLVEFKPITLLFGPNSAGKSTVIQALHYAREIFERHNLNPDKTILGGDAIDLGGFKSMVHKHDTSLPIRLKLELDLSNEDLPRYLEGYEDIGLVEWEETDLWDIPNKVETAWVEITVRWSDLINAPLLSTYSVGINGEDLVSLETTGDGKQINFSKLAVFNPIFLRGSSPERARKIAKKLFVSNEECDEDELGELGDIFLRLFELFQTDEGIPGLTKDVPLAGQVSALPQWGAPLKFPSTMWNKDVEFLEEGNFILLLSSLITGPGELIRDALSKFCYVGPLREVPKRGHQPATSPVSSRWSNGLAAYDELFFSGSEFIDKVNHWLGSDERLNSGYSVEVKEYREMQSDNSLMLALQQNRLLDEDIDFRDSILALPIKHKLIIHDDNNGVELEPYDIGVGISQVLPVIVAALSQSTGFIAIEQPELHIHPAFQVALGDLFIEQIQENSDLIFILETHSEHLLLRLMRRIRETYAGKRNDQKFPLQHDQLGISFVELFDGRTIIREMPVNEHGELIKAWPGGFFEESLGEVF